MVRCCTRPTRSLLPALFALAVLSSCTSLDPSGHAHLDAGPSESDGALALGRDAALGMDGQVQPRLDASPNNDASDTVLTADGALATPDADEPSLCSASQRECNGTCIPSDSCCTQADCPEGASCNAGSCSCPAGSHVCEQTCANDSSPASCGASCTPCLAPSGGSVECSAGSCMPACPAGQRSCAGSCIAESAACTGQCPATTHDCSGVCIANDSVSGCGASSCTPCAVPANGSATCDGSSCGFSCASGSKRCENSCIASSACCGDGDCQANATCAAGAVCACSAGFKACGNACIPNAQCCSSTDCQANATCNAGSCGCAAGFKSCNGACIANAACCSSSDCQANATCSAGSCGCNSSFKACGNACIPTSGCCTDPECGGPGQYCSANKCTSWCGVQTRPANVAVADYQCLDFEMNWPNASWVKTSSTGIGTTVSRSYSAPLSLGTTGTDGTQNAVVWSLAGAKPISTITFSGQISPDSHPSINPTPPQSELVCLKIGYTTACLSYTFKGSISTDDADAGNYTGLYMHWQVANPNSGAFTSDCALRAATTGSPLNLQAGVWNATVFSIAAATGAMNVSINGVAAAGCSQFFETDTSGEARFGVRPNLGWSVYYDSLTVAATR